MHRGPTGRRMPTNRENGPPRRPHADRSARAVRALLAASAISVTGCVDILGDYRTSGCGQADCSTWAMRFGDPADQAAAGVVAADNGDLVLLTNVSGAVDFGAGSSESAGLTDVFVTRLDQGGGLVWSKQLRGPGDDYGNAIALDPKGNVLVAGSFEQTAELDGHTIASEGSKDVFVAKLSPDGDVLWVQRFGDGFTQAAIGVASDLSSDVLVTGCVGGTMKVGDDLLASPASDDAFVMKLGPDGSPRWGLSAGGATTFDCGHRVTSDDAGNVFVAGVFTEGIAFEQPHTTAGKSDIFLAKVSPDGAPLWSRTFGGPETESAGGLVALSGGRVALVGSFEGTASLGGTEWTTAKASSDLFVCAVESDGKTAWSRGLGGGELELVTGATKDARGDLLVSGYSGPSTASVDVLLAKVSAKGDIEWSRLWEASGSQEAAGVAVDPNGDVVIAGNLKGTLKIGGHVLESAGQKDAFVAKLGSDPTPDE